MSYPAFVVLFALIAAILGAVTAASGLLSRYADEPLAALRSRGGNFYLFVNAGLAAIAYFVLVATVPSDAPLTGPAAPPIGAEQAGAGAAGDPGRASADETASSSTPRSTEETRPNLAAGTALTRAAAAATPHSPLRLLSMALFGGLGAVMLLRVQFSLVFQGEQRSIGPGSVIDAVLSTIDTAIDRDAAIRRADLVSKQMQGISFERAKIALPLLISGARRTVSRDQLDRLGGIVKEIETSPCSEELKSVSLGFALLDVTGEELFKQLIDRFKGHFGFDVPAPKPDAPEPVTPAPEPATPEPAATGGSANGDAPPAP